LLATAGEQAVYIWDLDEEGHMETIRTDLTGDRIQVSDLTWTARIKTHHPVHRVRRGIRLHLLAHPNARLLPSDRKEGHDLPPVQRLALVTLTQI